MLASLLSNILYLSSSRPIYFSKYLGFSNGEQLAKKRHKCVPGLYKARNLIFFEFRRVLDLFSKKKNGILFSGVFFLLGCSFIRLVVYIVYIDIKKLQ